MRKLSFIIGTAAVAVAAVAVAPSQATFRGTNGLLVYQKQVGKNANNVQLFTIRSDGTGETQLTHFADSSADGANWSADGNKIVFTRHWNPGGHNERFEIYTMKADGSRMKALPRAGKFTLGPNWMPDGRRIVFLEGTTNRIATINADGTKLRNPVVPGRGGVVCVFADGERIALLRPKTATSDTSAIFVAKLNGKSVKRITPWGGYAAKIDCSPDGTRVAYSAPSFDDGASNVYTIKADGTRRVQLTHTTDKAINNGLDSWSPDGTKIAFISNVGADSYQLYSLNTADGSGVAQITSGETHLASWGSHP